MSSTAALVPAVQYEQLPCRNTAKMVCIQSGRQSLGGRKSEDARVALTCSGFKVHDLHCNPTNRAVIRRPSAMLALVRSKLSSRYKTSRSAALDFR